MDKDEDLPSQVVAMPPSRSPVTPPTAARKSSSGTGASKSKSVGLGGGDVEAVSERLSLYQHGIRQAESAGEGSKARRYKRSLGILEKVRNG